LKSATPFATFITIETLLKWSSRRWVSINSAASRRK